MIRILKIIGTVLLVNLIILSIIPYLLHLQELPGKPFELLNDNSSLLSVEGINLHYRQWEEEGAEGVLLIHGFSGSNWHLVGHSMGGGVVAAMALQRPDQVQSVTLAAGAIPAAGRGRFGWVFHYPPLGRAVRHLATRVFLSEKNVERALASAYGRVPTKDEFEGYYRPLLIKDSDAALVEMLKARERNLLSDIEDLQTPMLLIWGAEDAWVQIEEGYKLNSLLKNSELVVLAGEGHCPMETAPLEFNSSLLRFLAEQR